jgi:hypothetical protein
MNDILSQVGPQTRGIIWSTKADVSPQNETYAALDYLFDGLLTSTLTTGEEAQSRVLLGESFGQPLYLYITYDQTLKGYGSYLELISPIIYETSDVVVIDEENLFSSLKKKAPEKISKKMRLI